MTDIWISICSHHQETDLSCPRCKEGYWTTEEEVTESQRLFRENCAAWYKEHNPDD